MKFPWHKFRYYYTETQLVHFTILTATTCMKPKVMMLCLWVLKIYELFGAQEN